MKPVFLNEMGIVCALGSGQEHVAEALFSPQRLRGLEKSDAFSPGRSLSVGAVQSALPELGDWPVELRGRNNALILRAIEQIRPAVDAAIARHGRERVAIVLGTSTSGVGESEVAQRQWLSQGHWPESFHYRQQEMGTAATFLAQLLGTRGPAHVISTACSSSTKALASAARLLRSGMVDAVIAGGADSLCQFTIAGFSALDSVSAQACNPFSRNRCGINIGEGAALFLLTTESGPVRLSGWGESSDAHHMSAPDPSGRGAIEALEQCFSRSGLRAGDIDYINLHGTATPQNDAMEAKVVSALFGSEVPVSSTKPLTGHTLGAAGAIEAAVCWLALARNPQDLIPPHHWDGQPDPELPALALAAPGARFGRRPRHAISQNFAFGGSNAALLMSLS